MDQSHSSSGNSVCPAASRRCQGCGTICCNRGVVSATRRIANSKFSIAHRLWLLAGRYGSLSSKKGVGLTFDGFEDIFDGAFNLVDWFPERVCFLQKRHHCFQFFIMRCRVVRYSFPHSTQGMLESYRTIASPSLQKKNSSANCQQISGEGLEPS